jgi:hypothetical protein
VLASLGASEMFGVGHGGNGGLTDMLGFVVLSSLSLH